MEVVEGSGRDVMDGGGGKMWWGGGMVKRGGGWSEIVDEVACSDQRLDTYGTGITILTDDVMNRLATQNTMSMFDFHSISLQRLVVDLAPSFPE